MTGTILSDRAAVSNDGIKFGTGVAVSGLNMIAARLSPGATSESSSSHLPPIEASMVAKPVTFPLGRSSRGTRPLATGSPAPTKTIVSVGPSNVHPHVAAIGPTQVRKRLRERRDARPIQRIVSVARHEHADASHAVALLRPGHHGPRCRAA